MIRIVLLTLLINGCSRAQNQVISQQFFAFGTLIDISYYGINKTQAIAATQTVEALFLQQHRSWHAWEPGALQELNSAIATDQAATPPASIIKLIRLAQQFEKQSQGLFNPAIGKLLRVWGFQQNDAPQWQSPDPARIQALVALAPSSLQLKIDGNEVTSSNAAVQLDFGAFAKGYALGKAIETLTENGVHNTLINAGGDLCVSGQPGERNWQVGIRHPRNTGVMASIELTSGQCLFTSGDYERFTERDDNRIHHIINPKTGYSATGARSVTVLAHKPALADAAATALFVAGPKQWQSIARAMQINYVLMVDAKGILHTTPAMANLLKIESDLEPEIRINKPVPLLDNG
ncbi:MAG: FAD:protein FMN transferase [Gammaproteobacteria bacterium]